ncbi:MFS transporter [Saccharopolyspora sp. NFXS83]|uniref:MFS transporter n=1 Tax=Saccharopolyspora sp. NFXS83 TaxID=2993560 RepID=UPI00224B50DF|nr:MFS transporter [Saccharopolyspora sp. NFXS83]MCX2734236.1 MFS transporter [Saccharopolyspora sp. NFXS83]
MARSAAPPRGAWLVWGVGAACYFVALFHRASLGVAAPDALVRFSAGPGVLALFSALQLGVYLVLQVPSGLLADRMGPRRVITGGVVALAVGSAVFAVSGSILGGVTGRVLIGIGDAFMFTNVLRVAAQWFPADRYGRVAALTGLVGGLGQVLSTVPLTAALHGLGWMSTFLGAAVLTALLAVVAAGVIRDRPAGAVVEAAGDVGERIGRTLRLVVAQRGTKHAFWVHFVLLSQFLAITTLWGAPWLTGAQGVAGGTAGALLLVSAVGFILGSLVASQWIAGRPRRRERYTLAMSVLVVLAWVVIVAWPGVLGAPLLVVVLAVLGFGGGAAMLAFDGAREANAVHRSGAASGVVNMGGFLAAVLIQVLVGAVLEVVSVLPAVAAYRWAFVPVVVLLVVGTAGQWWCRSRPVGARRG